MSKQACAEFFAKIDTDAALQQEVIKAIKGKEDDSILMEAALRVVEVAAKYGYNFTLQEATEINSYEKETYSYEILYYGHLY